MYLINRDVTNSIDYTLKDKGYIYFVVSKVNAKVNKHRVNLQDGIYIVDEKNLKFIFDGYTELILLDLPIIWNQIL